MPRRSAKSKPMSATSGRKTIDDLQQFARENALPVPDGFLASGEGGARLAGGVKVVEIYGSDEPIVVRRSYEIGQADGSLAALHDANDITRGFKYVVGPAVEFFGRVAGRRRTSSR